MLAQACKSTETQPKRGENWKPTANKVRCIRPIKRTILQLTVLRFHVSVHHLLSFFLSFSPECSHRIDERMIIKRVPTQAACVER
jgi:hypothetical protein